MLTPKAQILHQVFLCIKLNIYNYLFYYKILYINRIFNENYI